MNKQSPPQAPKNFEQTKAAAGAEKNVKKKAAAGAEKIEKKPAAGAGQF